MRNKIAVEKTSYMGFPRYYGETFSLKIYKWNQKNPNTVFIIIENCLNSYYVISVY